MLEKQTFLTCNFKIGFTSFIFVEPLKETGHVISVCTTWQQYCTGIGWSFCVEIRTIRTICNNILCQFMSYRYLSKPEVLRFHLLPTFIFPLQFLLCLFGNYKVERRRQSNLSCINGTTLWGSQSRSSSFDLMAKDIYPFKNSIIFVFLNCFLIRGVMMANMRFQSSV